MRDAVIYLASTSPRRRELLDQIGVRHELLVGAVDERRRAGEVTELYVARMALEKARDRADALDMLRQLAGRTHHVYTGVALVDGEREASRLSVSAVSMRVLSKDECARYWDSGEPVDKAGAYAIQGRGAQFIVRLEGSYSGVMGLPVFETAELLREFGVIL